MLLHTREYRLLSQHSYRGNGQCEFEEADCIAEFSSPLHRTADQVLTNSFEDVTAGYDGQVVVSILGELISVRGITMGKTLTQVLGQMFDESLLHQMVRAEESAINERN